MCVWGRGVPTDAVGPGHRRPGTPHELGGKTKDGEHRLNNGSLMTVEGFTKRGDIIVDQGWVIDRDFGRLSHGYVVTSHASQGFTVYLVLIKGSNLDRPLTEGSVTLTHAGFQRHGGVSVREMTEEEIRHVGEPNRRSTASRWRSSSHMPHSRNGSARKPRRL